MNDDVERSSAAKFATSVFYDDMNDIDIYVEDTENVSAKIYTILFNRLLAEKLSVSKIFPLGGRSEVIDWAKKDLSNKRKSIFIIDGDLYLICGEKEQLPVNVIRLDRYCIENYLCDEKALIEILDDEEPIKQHGELINIFKFDDWKLQAIFPLEKLFMTYAVSHFFGSGHPTTSRKCSDILKNDKGNIDAVKVDIICQQIRNDLETQFGKESVANKYEDLIRNIDKTCCFITKYVSAKSYTLPIMLVRMRSTVDFRPKKLALKIRMAKHCDLRSLDNIKEKIYRHVF